MSVVSISLKDELTVKLRQARYPLLALKEAKVVANDISLDPKKEKVLIISGPNAGGKTVVLKTLGLLGLAAKSGLLLPVQKDSELFIFENTFVEMGDLSKYQ